MEQLRYINLDINQLLMDMRQDWVRGDKYNTNPTAFTRIRPVANSILFCCPHHPENYPSCGLMVDYPYVWHCFGCESSGNLLQLIGYIKNINEFQAMRYILTQHALLSSSKRTYVNLGKFFNKEVAKSISESELEIYKKKRHTYLYKRGFSDYTLNKFEVGYDVTNDTIVFPVRDAEGVVRFIQRRSVRGKFFFNEKNSVKKDILYGLYYLLQSNKKVKDIYLVESITDVLSCYEAGFPALSVMGRILFKGQIRELLRAGISKATIFFDNDIQGITGTERAIELLKQTPIRVNRVVYPNTCKDANELLLSNTISQIKTVTGLT